MIFVLDIKLCSQAQRHWNKISNAYFFPAEFPAFIIIEIQKDLWLESVLLPLEGSQSIEHDKDGHIKFLIEGKLLSQLWWKNDQFSRVKSQHDDLIQVFILLNHFGNGVKLAIAQHCFRYSHLNFNVIFYLVIIKGGWFCNCLYLCMCVCLFVW